MPHCVEEMVNSSLIHGCDLCLGSLIVKGKKCRHQFQNRVKKRKIYFLRTVSFTECQAGCPCMLKWERNIREKGPCELRVFSRFPAYSVWRVGEKIEANRPSLIIGGYPF